jgi:hypothetical protein
MNGNLSGIARPHLTQTQSALDELGKQEALRAAESNSHYSGYKVLDFIESLSLGFLEGNVVKYVCRHMKKGGAKDIDKAIDYLNQIKRLKYNDPNR